MIQYMYKRGTVCITMVQRCFVPSCGPVVYASILIHNSVFSPGNKEVAFSQTGYALDIP